VELVHKAAGSADSRWRQITEIVSEL